MRPAVHPSVQTSWPTSDPWHSLMPFQTPPLKASMVGSSAVSTNAATHLQQIYTAWVMTCTLSVPTFLCLDRLREQRICAHGSSSVSRAVLCLTTPNALPPSEQSSQCSSYMVFDSSSSHRRVFPWRQSALGDLRSFPHDSQC